MIADLELEPVHLADTMSPRAVADAVAEQVRHLGGVPLGVLTAAMRGAGYDMQDVRNVAFMVGETPGIRAVRGDLCWVGD